MSVLSRLVQWVLDDATPDDTADTPETVKVDATRALDETAMVPTTFIPANHDFVDPELPDEPLTVERIRCDEWGHQIIQAHGRLPDGNRWFTATYLPLAGVWRLTLVDGEPHHPDPDHDVETVWSRDD